MATETSLSILNPKPTWQPGPKLLHHLVSPPGQTKALEHVKNGQRNSHTYGELHQVSDAIAARLSHIAGNHERQFVVPVLMEQSPILYASLLGILKAGGAFCPLNIDAPPERVAFILNDVQAPAILVSQELVSRVPENSLVQRIVVDWETCYGSTHAEETPRSLSGDDLAYVMYTSGSTGTPKGVGISHSAVTQTLLAHEEHMPLFSRFLQFAAPTFDVSVFEIFFPLTRGSTLVSAERSEMLEDLPAVIRDMDVDACELTPTVAGGLLKSRNSVPKLKLLLTIGEMLTEPVVREFGGDAEKSSILWAMYGPTEATIHCTLQTAMSASSSVRKIGVPFRTVSCFVIRAGDRVLDSTFDVLLRGEPGELVVGGHQLADGYLNRPEQTASSFISTPYGRLYRTGDKARMLDDGTIECLGRLSDGQVKLRGQRMELGEVQEAILRTPGCRNAVATVHESNLVAFCAVDSNVLEDAILDQCKRWLPSFMLPSEIVLVDSFPKLPSGKVDRKKLVVDFEENREKDLNDNSSNTEEVPNELIRIVADTLHRELHLNTQLSSVGLDSLSAIQLSSALRRGGYQVDVFTLLQSRNLSELWRSIHTATSGKAFPRSFSTELSLFAKLEDIISYAPTVRASSDQIEDIIPCTPLQSAMLAETMQHSERYWNYVEMGTSFNIKEVLEALRCLIQRHEILRTGFVPTRQGFASIIFESSGHPSLQEVEVFTDGPYDLLQPFRVQAIEADDSSRSRLLFTLHHAIYDGWSMDLLLTDLLASIQGHTPQLRPQFREISAYYHHHISNSDDTHTSAKAFWAEHLLGWTKDPFPSLVGHPPVSSMPATITGNLDTSYDEVRMMSNKLGCSVQAIFQASLALEWAAIIGSEDIVLGSVTSGRTLPIADIESILGPSIASLPLRINLAKFANVWQLLNHIHSSNRAIMEHATVPLSDIRKLTELQAGQSLYDVLFSYQESPKSSVRRSTDLWETRHVDRLETKLLLEIEPTISGFTFQVTYHPDVLSSDICDSFITQFKTIFVSIMSNTTSSLTALKHRLEVNPSIYNPTPTRFGGTADLASMFEATASLYPQSDAICFAEPGSDRSLRLKSITYNELNRIANKIAHFLFSEGLGTRQVVALVMEKSILLYATILAVVKIGCAYLPILPSTPAERMRKIFAQAKTRHCLLDRASFGQLSMLRGPRLVDVEGADLVSFNHNNVGIAPDGSRLAYVIYTSGTTGEPKGVAVTQLNITSNIDHLRNIYPRSPETPSRLLQACSQAFDVSVFEIFYAWHSGMCLCAGTNDTLFADLEHAIRELDITHLSLTPTVAALVNPNKTPTVSFLVTAGEPLTHSVLEAWGGRLWQGYGPSETTNICSVKKMEQGAPVQHLGWTFPNTSVFVVHLATLNAVPIGCVGEFCYGGDQIAQGYLHMPKLTSERFVEHPSFGRIYRSGDMGRMLPDGSLVILGRVDDQLKLRGQRIETGEINNAIVSSGAAKSSVTIVAQKTQGVSEQLVAFYVPPGDIPGCGVLDIDPSVTRLLFSLLEARLPSYMVPSYMIPLARIPQTPSGKIHHRQLLDLFKNLPSSYLEESIPSERINDAHGNQWSELEMSIANIISAAMTLEVPEIRRWSPFASLGIDSISAIGIARSLSDYLEHRVPVSAIIRNPTIVQLARHLETDTFTPSRHNAPALLDSSFIHEARSSFSSLEKVEAILPCTPLQEAMLSAGSTSYYNKIMLRLNTSPKDMKSYWEQMTKRHQILRTCFITTQDINRPVAQVVLQDWNIAWVELVATKPSFDDVVREHMALLPEPINSKQPPVSFASIRYRGSIFLSLICHHALYDGVAMDNLWREVEALANGWPLPEPVPYGPFLLEMMNLPQDVENFWKAQIHGIRPSTLFSSSRTMDQASTTKSLGRPLNITQNQLRSLGLPMISLFQASWATTLSLLYDTTDVCFGNVVSGRSVDVEGVDRLAAPTFNTIPIRTDLSKSPHAHGFLKGLQKLNADLLPYQFTPLRLAQKLAGSPGRSLFETLLLLQKPLHEMDDSVWILEEDSGSMDVPVVCEVVPCPSLNTIVVNLHYDTNAVESSTANALIDILEFSMDSILRSPYAHLPKRDGMPGHLKDAIGTLRPRKQRSESSRDTGDLDRPWSATQLDIRQAFSDLSGFSISRISQSTTIFQLGLDSINAVQLASMLRNKGYTISASDVVAFPTCTKLEVRLRENPRYVCETSSSYNLQSFSDAVSAKVKLSLPSNMVPEAVLPCTPMQCGMIQSWFESAGKNYFNTMKFEMDLAVSIDSLSKGWESLFHSHPMLRTGFVQVDHPDATFAMVRHGASSVKLPITHAKHPEHQKYILGLQQACISESYLPTWGTILSESSEGLVMTLCIHHAIYDAESLTMLLSALSNFLQGTACMPFSPIEPSLSSLMSRSIDNVGDAERFWRSKTTSTVVNKFPVMTPLRELPGEMVTRSVISGMSASTLQEAAKEANASIQAIVQATWTRILSSYLGEDSLVFGVSLSGRVEKAMQDAPLPCLVTLPVVASNMELNANLLQYMMAYVTDVHKHQFSPLSQVQKWLGHPASPVFDTLVSYRKSYSDEGPSWPFKLTHDNPVVDYPVSLEVEACSNDELRISTTFKPDVFSAGQANLMLQQFDATMAHLALHPTGAESDLHLGASSLFSRLPPEVPDMQPPVRYLHSFVEEQAKSYPDKVALEFVWSLKEQREQWTYQELDQLGNQVANMLADVAPINSIIAVHFDKCPEAYFSILGILKAGCSFVALDTTAPEARKRFILEDSQASCVLTNSTNGFKLGDTEILHVSEDKLQRYSPVPRCLDGSFTSQSTCYCLYTSGTTGTPKGCEISHDNVVHAMMAFQALFSGHWDKNSRWLQFAALHFDVSVLEQYWSWSVGITVVAAPKELILDDLTGSIDQLNITHIDLTPSLARLTRPDDVPSLCRGVFITGGESLKQEILDVWGPKAVIYNAYGPTEATIGVTMYQRVPANGRPSNIGKQFPNVGSYVFKPGTKRPVLRGGVGELCVSGRLVGKGYLNRPDLTEERFPTLAETGDRVYRTGDLVRVLHDGCFDFLGRADDQVKLRGQRLEIGELNHVIRGVPEIHDAATIVVSQANGEKSMLVAFMVAESSSGSRGLEVLEDKNGLGDKAKEACRNQLPAYMVPTYCLLLPLVPLSVNNKAEVKELRRLFLELPHEQLMHLTGIGSGSSTSISGELLSRVKGILARFGNSNLEDISDNSSIFDFGVDSISAMTLSTLLKKEGFSGATPAVVLRNPIVADLAQAMAKAGPSSHTGKIKEAEQLINACSHRYRALACRELALAPSNIDCIAPCSSLQQGMLSKAMTMRDRGAYFNSFDLTLSPDINVHDLCSSWESLVAEEAILRAQFLSTISGFIQVITKRAELRWETVHVQDTTETKGQLSSNKQRWLSDNQTHITRPLEFLIIRDGSQALLRINIFHAIYDGNSFDLMLSRVSHFMRNKAWKHGPSLLEAFTHGPLWNHDFCQKFWTDQLKGWRPSPMPILCSTPASGPQIAQRHLAEDLIEKIRRSQNVTLQSVVLALWVSVLQQSGLDPLTVGVVISGRSIELPGVERTIGPLFNTLPFFNKTLRRRTWVSLIQQCQDFGSSLVSFQHVPLQKVQRWCSNGQPLFDTLFALQVEPPDGESTLDLWEIQDGESTPDYPLALEVTVSRDGLTVAKLVAQAHIADQVALVKMLDSMQYHLQMMADDAHGVIPVNDALGEDSAHYMVDPLEGTSPEHEDDFMWDELSTTVRQEVASVAAVGLSEVTPTITMLQLGLDSIDIIKLSAKLRTRGIDIPASKIMRLQSLPSMVAETQTLDADSSSSEVDIQTVRRRLEKCLQSQGHDLSEVEEILPTTALQESMLASMLESGFEWYFNHDVLRVRNDVDMSQLKVAWDQVVKAIPILRTAFYPVEDTGLDMSYCQVVLNRHSTWEDFVEARSMEDLDRTMANAKARAKRAHGREKLFQLSTATIETERFVVISIAHALYDGWSLGLLYRELDKAYNGLVPSTPSTELFFTKTMGQSSSSVQDFWAEYLQGSPSTLIPQRTKSDVGPVKGEKTSDVSAVDIQAFCRRLSISLQALCQACWAVILARLTGKLDITFGVVLSGRDFEGAEDLVFPTMNTVAFRCILHGSVSEFLAYMEETLADVRQHQSYPLRKAMGASNAPAGELFNTLFLLQKAIADENSKIPLLESVRGFSAVDYPICVEAETLGNDLIWRTACQSDYISQADVSELLETLDQVIRFFVRSSASEILSFSEKQVSICGLPSTKLDESTNMQPVEHNEVEIDDQTEESLVIRKVLSEVSGVPEPDIQLSSNLYHLGLDSISAIKVATLLRRNGVDISTRDIIRADNIGHLISMTGTRQYRPDIIHRQPEEWRLPSSLDLGHLLRQHNLSSAEIEATLPALPMQVYMLGTWQNSRRTVFYPEFTYMLRNGCSKDAIYAAWGQVMQWTPILRTCFISTGLAEIPVLQIILNADSSRPMVDFMASWDKQEDAWRLHLKIHHALYDGVSLPVIMHNLALAIDGWEDDPSTSKGDTLARWTRYTTNPTLPSCRAGRQRFWTRYLSGCPRNLPGSEPRTGYPIERVSYIERSAVPKTSSLRQMAARNGVSVQSLFLAAYAKVLSRREGGARDGTTRDDPHDDVVFGIYFGNRSGEVAEGLPLSFPRLNLVPLRVGIEESLIAMASRVQGDLGEIASDGRAEVGLWEIAEWTGVQLKTFVNFLSLPGGEAEGVGLEAIEGVVVTPRPCDADDIGDVVVRDAFPPAIDIEASLNGDGLDVGVFAPNSVVASEAIAAELVDQIVAALQYA